MAGTQFDYGTRYGSSHVLLPHSRPGYQQLDLKHGLQSDQPTRRFSDDWPDDLDYAGNYRGYDNNNRRSDLPHGDNGKRERVQNGGARRLPEDRHFLTEPRRPEHRRNDEYNRARYGREKYSRDEFERENETRPYSYAPKAAANGHVTGPSVTSDQSRDVPLYSVPNKKKPKGTSESNPWNVDRDVGKRESSFSRDQRENSFRRDQREYPSQERYKKDRARESYTPDPIQEHYERDNPPRDRYGREAESGTFPQGAAAHHRTENGDTRLHMEPEGRTRQQGGQHHNGRHLPPGQNGHPGLPGHKGGNNGRRKRQKPTVTWNGLNVCCFAMVVFLVLGVVVTGGYFLYKHVNQPLNEVVINGTATLTDGDFHDDYSNLTSTRAKSFIEDFCRKMNDTVSSKVHSFELCSVMDLREGSIVADFLLHVTSKQDLKTVKKEVSDALTVDNKASSFNASWEFALYATLQDHGDVGTRESETTVQQQQSTTTTATEAAAAPPTTSTTASTATTTIAPIMTEAATTIQPAGANMNNGPSSTSLDPTTDSENTGPGTIDTTTDNENTGPSTIDTTTDNDNNGPGTSLDPTTDNENTGPGTIDPTTGSENTEPGTTSLDPTTDNENTGPGTTSLDPTTDNENTGSGTIDPTTDNENTGPGTSLDPTIDTSTIVSSATSDQAGTTLS